MKLPTMEQFLERCNSPYPERYAPPEFICPKCGRGGMCRDTTISLTSYPPRSRYQCDECGHIEYV